MPDTWTNDLNIGSQPAWFPWEGRSPRIILSSTCLFRRNLDGVLFPPFMGNLGEATKVSDTLSDILAKHPEYGFVNTLQPQELTPLMRNIFAFHHLASKDFLSRSVARLLYYTADHTRVCRVNDQNHLTIQQTAPGLQLDAIVQELNGMLSVLGMDVPFARDKYFGYLCTKPEYCGTGFSAHVTLNLPGIVYRQFEEQTENAAAELGFTMKFDTARNSTLSHLATVSACNLPRCSPQEIAARLNDFVKRLERHELDARQMILADSDLIRLKDITARAYALLRFACLLNAKEATTALAVLWMADELGIRPINIPQPVFFKLFTTTLCQLRMELDKGRVDAPVSVQAARAKAIQKILLQFE